MSELEQPSWEVLEGYVVDQACIRKYPQAKLLARSQSHTRECALMGHCIESGYGLIGEEGHTYLLEPASTPMVVAAIQHSEQDRGIGLRALREMHDGEMRTTRLEEV